MGLDPESSLAFPYSLPANDLAEPSLRVSELSNIIWIFTLRPVLRDLLSLDSGESTPDLPPRHSLIILLKLNMYSGESTSRVTVNS